MQVAIMFLTPGFKHVQKNKTKGKSIEKKSSVIDIAPSI